MDRTPKPGEFYRHFKNKLYQVMAVATHSETGEQMVVYQALYGDFKVYVRPLAMFVSPVDQEKYPEAGQEYRFERVEFGDRKAEAAREASGAQEGTGNLQEAAPEPLPGSHFLERFLDAKNPEEQLSALRAMAGHVGEREIQCICVALDIPYCEKGSAEEKLEEIRRSILLQKKYDGGRLRRRGE